MECRLTGPDICTQEGLSPILKNPPAGSRAGVFQDYSMGLGPPA